MVFMPLVLVWIGQFCCDVIGHQNVKVIVTGWLLFCCYFLFVYCLFVGFVWSHVWVICKVQVAVDIDSEVLCLCTSFLMSVVVGNLWGRRSRSNFTNSLVVNSLNPGVSGVCLVCWLFTWLWRWLTAQVVKPSLTNNSLSEDHPHPDHHTRQTTH